MNPRSPTSRPSLQRDQAMVIAGTNPLDQEIEAAEQSLIEDRQRTAQHVDQLLARLHGQMRLGIGVGLATIGVALLIRRLRRPRASEAVPRYSPPAAPAWLSSLAMLLQLLPGAGRRAFPETASALFFGLIVPVLGRLLQRPKAPGDLPTDESRR